MIDWILPLIGGIVAGGSAALWLTGRQRRQREAELLAREREQIGSVLNQAGERARGIIEEAEGVRRQLREDVSQTADRLVARVWQAYEAELKNSLKVLNTEIRQAAVVEVKNIRDRLTAYEAAAKKEIQQQVQKTVPIVVSRLAGKSIPVEIHEDVVVQAVAEAAAEGFFTTPDEK